MSRKSYEQLETELEQSKYKPPYDARPMRMLRHHIECDCLATRRGVLREIEDLFAIELKKRDERNAELEQAIAATLGGIEEPDTIRNELTDNGLIDTSAELGSGTCAQCAKDMGAYADSLCDPLKERINELLRCLKNDWRICASWDGLRKFWCIELTDEGVELRDAANGTLTAEQVREAIERHSAWVIGNNRCFHDGAYEEIADELNAELGSEINGDTSDGYHTFNELYHHRAVLFSVIVRDHRELAWKARKHHDGTMHDGMFIVGIETPEGQATYHYDLDPYWGMFDCEEREFAPEWDGHTSDEAIARIAELGSGTCDAIRDERTQSIVCSKCDGGGLTIPNKGQKALRNYCPNCGAKVKNKPCQKPANERAAAESSESGLRGSQSDYPIMDGFSYGE